MKCNYLRIEMLDGSENFELDARSKRIGEKSIDIEVEFIGDFLKFSAGEVSRFIRQDAVKEVHCRTVTW